MLGWVGIDQPMKMSASSRGVDKELHVNNILLQTLPKKDKRIRKVFIPDNNYELWFMDLDLEKLGPSKTSLIAGTPTGSISSQAA